MSELSTAFGEVIRRRRITKSISQEELADLAGIHRTYMSKIELGKVRLGLDAARKVATGLGLPLSVLIAEAEELLNSTDVSEKKVGS